MFNFFANLFGYVLNFIYNFVDNYGLAIIIFTVLLKGLMLPISINQQKTMKKSQKVQEKIRDLQDKYSNDPTKLNQEMMAVYKENNMSPFSGCLSSIVQIVLVISMFYLVSKPLTYMKHVDSETISNYVTEITESTGTTPRYQEIAVIKAKGETDENVNLNMSFLGLDLSDIPSQDYTNIKAFIIPALYVITTIISMKMTNINGNKSKDNKKLLNEKNEEQTQANTQKTQKEKLQDADDTAAEMTKSMSLMMPIMSVSIALIAPLGLALYWFVSNLVMIIERLIINKFVKMEE